MNFKNWLRKELEYKFSTVEDLFDRYEANEFDEMEKIYKEVFDIAWKLGYADAIGEIQRDIEM